MGTAKDKKTIFPSTLDEPGEGFFYFKNDISVFDFGEVEEIPGKGEALCIYGGKTFELVEEEGIPTHYQGLGDKGVGLKDLKEPTDKMKIKLVNVPDLPVRKTGREVKYDYESYGKKTEIRMIPLECIFRNTIPIGSSFRGRHSPREVGLDTTEWPEETVDLENPIVEFSTKYESKDRYIDDEEALKISGLSESEFRELKEYAKKINKIITDHCEGLGLKHDDGKVEFAYLGGKIVLVDVAGTPDENRITYKGRQISKEIARQWYKKNNKEWVEDIERAKEEAKKIGEPNWKKLMKVERKRFPSLFKLGLGNVYRTGANKYSQRNFFDVPNLKNSMDYLYSNFL